MKKGAKRRKLEETLSLPTLITGSIWTKTEKARSSMDGPSEKVKPCARLEEEKTLILRLGENFQPLDDKLMISETVSRVLTALRSITDKELLTVKLKEYRPKTLKWGVDNGREEKAESFLREDIIMVRSRSVIIEDDKDYRTDEEMEQIFQECQKKKSPKVTDNRVVDVRKARGEGVKTKENDDMGKSADRFWEGNIPAPMKSKITPSKDTAHKQGKTEKNPLQR